MAINPTAAFGRTVGVGTQVVDALRSDGHHVDEIVAADSVVDILPDTRSRSTKTRMRTGIKPIGDMIEPEKYLSRDEVDRLLRQPTDAA